MRSLMMSIYYFCPKEFMMNKKSRRIFLKVITAGIATFLLYLWNKLTLVHLKTTSKKEHILSFNKTKTVTFFDDFIVISAEEKPKVLSSYCTHLGCKIDKFENGRLICPCHGSEYNLNGEVLKGPAHKSLEMITFRISENGESLLIST